MIEELETIQIDIEASFNEEHRVPVVAILADGNLVVEMKSSEAREMARSLMEAAEVAESSATLEVILQATIPPQQSDNIEATIRMFNTLREVIAQEGEVPTAEDIQQVMGVAPAAQGV